MIPDHEPIIIEPPVIDAAAIKRWERRDRLPFLLQSLLTAGIVATCIYWAAIFAVAFWQQF